MNHIVAEEYGLEFASSPFGGHSLKAAMGKAEVLLVEGRCTDCCTLAELGYGETGHTGSFGEHKPTVPRIVPVLVPALGRALGPGPHAAYRQPRLAFAAEHRGQLIC